MKSSKGWSGGVDELDDNSTHNTNMNQNARGSYRPTRRPIYFHTACSGPHPESTLYYTSLTAHRHDSQESHADPHYTTSRTDFHLEGLDPTTSGNTSQTDLEVGASKRPKGETKGTVLPNGQNKTGSKTSPLQTCRSTRSVGATGAPLRA